MAGTLIDFKQESSVDPSGSLTPSPQSENYPQPGKIQPWINPTSHTAENGMTSLGGGKQNSMERGKCWPWSKRDRLKRDPSLDKLDEEVDGLPSTGDPAFGKTTCPDYFGVKSYLHHFYEWPTYKDPNLYEDGWDDTSRLLYPGGPRKARCCRCSSICWKCCAFIGICLLFAGSISVLMGYLVPPKDATVGFVSADKQVVDRFATEYNERLDLCKIIGLIVFCAGGLMLTIALFIPSVFYRYCDEEKREAAFSVQSGDVSVPRRDFVGAVVPATSKLAEVQPVVRANEPHLAQKTPVEAHYGQPMPGHKR